MKLHYLAFLSIFFVVSSPIVLWADSENKLVKDISKTIFEISTCRCEGNNGCTRGCKMSDQIDKEDIPKIRRCYGKKFSSKSTKYCTRYVKAAIMNVVEAFLSPYCKEYSPYKGYQQCIEDFNSDIMNSRVNICQHSYVFHSALCMLNLDGKDSSIYNNISDKQIRRNCKAWDNYNQMLYSISFPVLDLEDIPLFKIIDPEKYPDFQRDTSQIPTGAIIVSKSESVHGHVEIKTNQTLCGPNKSSVCFCSDFCLERKKYTWPFKVLAVYEWNPEFLEYFEPFRLL